MRLYTDETRTECTYAVCNRCGARVTARNDVLQKDVLHVEKVWGYFSERDGKKQVWDLCENCYNEFTKSFRYPIEEEDITEYL